MRRQLTLILTILILVSCQNNTSEKQLTNLEKFIIDTDSLTSNSNTFDQIVNFIQSKKPEFNQREVKITTEGILGLYRETEFSSDYDTTGNFKDRVLFSLKIKGFTSERQAANAFKEIIEFHACCIPDEDIIKLKNFENVDHFKNIASTTILIENTIIEFIPANQTIVNEDISKLLGEILKERKYLKLEVGEGGPAIWTRKQKNNTP